jgi:hypothetical protein
MKPLALLLALLLALAAAPAVAGSVEGLNLVWVNLGGAPAVDVAVKQAINDDKACWGSDALVYMDKRPPGITNALVQAALVQRQPAAQRRLRAHLRKAFGEADAFDGVVAYVQRPQPRLLSLGTQDGRVRSGLERDADGSIAWQPSLCAVMPPLSRRP